MRIIQTIQDTMAAGPGIRCEIYVSGCCHACKGCHNPETWDLNQGEELTVEYVTKLKEEIISNPLILGVTITGGDPLHPSNAAGLLMLLQELDALKLNVWVFTGYTIEELLDAPIDYNQLYALKYIDVLVDGRFDELLKETKGFRGSSNQRYIKAKELMENGDLCPRHASKFVF